MENVPGGRPPDGVLVVALEWARLCGDVLPPPVRHGGFGPVLGPVPAHGRDTEAVLQECGAGRRMLAAATRLLAGAGFTDASLWVLSGNHSARGFYESQGWRYDGTEHEWVPADGIRVPEVRYARPLGS